MKFRINNRTWDIVEVTQEEMCKERGVTEDKSEKYFGLCCYDTQKILLWDNLPKEQKRQTLIHELAHCYIGMYIGFSVSSLTQDSVCDLLGNSHDIIHEIVEKYFNR